MNKNLWIAAALTLGLNQPTLAINNDWGTEPSKDTQTFRGILLLNGGEKRDICFDLSTKIDEHPDEEITEPPTHSQRIPSFIEGDRRCQTRLYHEDRSLRTCSGLIFDFSSVPLKETNDGKIIEYQHVPGKDGYKINVLGEFHFKRTESCPK